MALGSTQPLTEMSTRNVPGGKGRPTRKAENLTAICESIVWKMWETRRFTTLWPSMTCYRYSLTFLFLIRIVGGGVQAGSNRHVGGDYDDGVFGGMKIGKVTEVLGENLPQRLASTYPLT
jgi:hypothetical protein